MSTWRLSALGHHSWLLLPRAGTGGIAGFSLSLTSVLSVSWCPSYGSLLVTLEAKCGSCGAAAGAVRAGSRRRARRGAGSPVGVPCPRLKVRLVITLDLFLRQGVTCPGANGPAFTAP